MAKKMPLKFDKNNQQHTSTPQINIEHPNLGGFFFASPFPREYSQVHSVETFGALWKNHVERGIESKGQQHFDDDSYP